MSALLPSNHPRFSFIVRIWFEIEPNVEGFAPALRGSIQRIGTAQVQYFHTFDQLVEFLQDDTDWQGDSSPL